MKSNDISSEDKIRLLKELDAKHFELRKKYIEAREFVIAKMNGTKSPCTESECPMKVKIRSEKQNN